MPATKRLCKWCAKPLKGRPHGKDWVNFCSPACVEAHKVRHGTLRASRLERDFIEQLSEAGLEGVPQFPVGPFVFDLAFPQVMLLVEVDGEAYHTAAASQERDDRKDSFAQSMGWRVQRVPHGIIRDFPKGAVQLVMDAFFAP